LAFSDAKCRLLSASSLLFNDRELLCLLVLVLTPHVCFSTTTNNVEGVEDIANNNLWRTVCRFDSSVEKQPKHVLILNIERNSTSLFCVISDHLRREVAYLTQKFSKLVLDCGSVEVLETCVIVIGRSRVGIVGWIQQQDFQKTILMYCCCC